MLYNLGIRLFKNSEEASELLHDTYLRAKENYHTYRGESKFSTWVYSIARNIGLGKINEKKEFAITGKKDNNQFWIENILDENQSSSSEKVILDEQRQHIQEELSKLPETYRLPIVLFYYENMSYKEIAGHLGEKEGTIKSYIFRGKAILRGNIKYE